MCNLNVIVVLEFISRDLYLLFVIRFSSKFQNSVFNQHMRPKSGLKFPRPNFATRFQRYPGSNEVTIVYIMVWVGIFELAVRIHREFSGRSNLDQSEPW